MLAVFYMEAPTISDLSIVFGNLISKLMALGGAILFIMLLVGGFKYLTSGGDPKAAEEAKKTLTYAIGGVILLAGSYIILRIIGSITGTTDTITDFVIYRQ